MIKCLQIMKKKKKKTVKQICKSIIIYTFYAYFIRLKSYVYIYIYMNGMISYLRLSLCRR